MHRVDRLGTMAVSLICGASEQRAAWRTGQHSRSKTAAWKTACVYLTKTQQQHCDPMNVLLGRSSGDGSPEKHVLSKTQQQTITITITLPFLHCTVLCCAVLYYTTTLHYVMSYHVI